MEFLAKLDENDVQEYNLKKMLERTKDEIEKSRELHRKALLDLKQQYDDFNEFYHNNENNLNAQVNFNRLIINIITNV